ncbi:MAG: hypothetical protein IKX85_02540, partial [Clostridia bacterium]|nr:hypothetical protein [Clostridia bacterium]
MRRKLFLIGGACLSLAAAVLLILLFLIGISPETGLVTNAALLISADSAAALLTVFWIVASFFVRDLPKAEKKAPQTGEKSKTSGQPRPVDRVVLDKLPKHAPAFYVTAVFIWMAAALFFILYTVSDFSVFHLAIAVMSVLSVAAFVRAAIIHIAEKTVTSDAFLLPMPIAFSALFAIFVYQTVARMPQVAVYYSEILALIGLLLGIYLFLSHFFGEPVRRLHVFSALFMTSFAGIMYLVKMAVLFG